MRCFFWGIRFFSLLWGPTAPEWGRLRRCAAMLLAVQMVPCGALAAGKIDTSAFNAYYASQSRKLHGHMLTIIEAYNDLAGRGAVGPMKDALAVRGCLSACWELFLNAGDMIYVYDRIDPGCEKSVQAVGELMRSGLAVVAGKLEKELQWFAMSAKNLKGQPIAPHLAEMERDVRDTASAFRSFAAEFAKPIAAEPGGQPQRGQGKQPVLSGPTSPRQPVPPAPVSTGPAARKGSSDVQP